MSKRKVAVKKGSLVEKTETKKGKKEEGMQEEVQKTEGGGTVVPVHVQKKEKVSSE